MGDVARKDPFKPIRDLAASSKPLVRGLLARFDIGNFRLLAGSFGEEVETREGNRRLAEMPENALDQMTMIYELWYGSWKRSGLRAKAVAALDGHIAKMLETSDLDTYWQLAPEKAERIAKLYGPETLRTVNIMRTSSAFESPKALEKWLTREDRFGTRYVGINFGKMFDIAQELFSAVPVRKLAERREMLEVARDLLAGKSPETQREIDAIVGAAIFGKEFWAEFTGDVVRAIPLLKGQEQEDDARRQDALAAATVKAEHAVERFAKKGGLLLN